MAKWISALTLVICLASASALQAQDMAKPIGRWQRKVGKTTVTLNIDSNRLHIVCTGDKVVTLHADYAITHDGLIYGVVTSIECEENDETDMTKTLFDAPFSFRFRIDEGALIIHDMKAHDADSKDDMWNGRYKAIIQPAAVRAAIPPPPACVEDSTPSALMSSFSAGSYVQPPSPIAPSFSSSKDLEKVQQIAPKDTGKVYNSWMTFVR